LAKTFANSMPGILFHPFDLASGVSDGMEPNISGNENFGGVETIRLTPLAGNHL
jgi:hypothetical protein